MKNGIFLLFCVFVLSGCASLLNKVVEKPKLNLQQVSFRDANLKGGTLLFTISVDNPNDIDLKVDQINYRIFVNNKAISTAQTEKPVNVPAKSKANVEIPLPIEYTKIFSDLKELMFASTSTYKIEGDAKFALFSVPFTKEGSIKLR